LRIKCFTHSDLDGVVSNLLICKYYSTLGYNHSTENCSTGDNVDRKIKEYINSKEYSESDLIIITDVSMSYEVACILDVLPNKKILIDHHASAQKDLGRNNPKGDFPWAYVREGDSATMLVYKYLNNITKTNKELNDMIREYRPLVVVTDLWDTKSRISEDFVLWLPQIENILGLMNCVGFSNFKARFLLNAPITLTELEMAKVETVTKIKLGVMKYTNIFIKTKEYKEYAVCYGVCFASLYRSEVAEYAFQNNADLAFIAMIDMNGSRVSFRRNVRHPLEKDMDLTKVVKQFNSDGGGHPFACAFGYKMDDYSIVINRLLTGEFILE
jgi:oligoribonuclease NrnB/cAMP/cGMP phosphodiesterase (DHH superfamily)